VQALNRCVCQPSLCWPRPLHATISGTIPDGETMKNPLFYPARALAYAVSIAFIGSLDIRFGAAMVLAVAAGVGIEILMVRSGIR